MCLGTRRLSRFGVFAMFPLRTLAFLVLALVSWSPADAADPTPRPNIVLIFADDLGWKDVGYNGSKWCETPNIDKLAAEGMTFRHAYAAAGNCAPSRACLLSGTYTPRHDVYAVGSTDRGPKKLMRLVPIPNKSGLPVSNVTMADALKAGGYATGIFGKWHLDGPDGARPKEQGFDTYFDSRAKPNPKQDKPKDPKGVYSLTAAACQFIEDNKDRPFFCYVPHHAIHSALEARPESLSRFREKMPDARPADVLYAACTYDLDDGVGILLKKLADLGLEKNTLVVFTSDNGATQQSPQEPLRGSKGGYYEGGIREPTIVRWPGVVKPGTECTVPVISVDFYPTFLEVAGVPVPAGKVLDGVSLVPLLKGEPKLDRPAIFWHFPGYLDSPVVRGRDPVFRTRPVSVIRKGPWKLHLYHEEWRLDGGKDAFELYNIDADPGERKNLADTNTAKRNELLADLEAWFKATDAKLPTEKNPKYDPDAQPPIKKKNRKKEPTK